MPKLVYYEIPSTDVKRSSAFYAALFGWPMTPSGDRYVMFSGDGDVGGGIEHAERAPGEGVRVYIGVDDIPATLAKVRSLGGKVVKEKTEIAGGYGYWASFEDPGGCRSVMLWSKA